MSGGYPAGAVDVLSRIAAIVDVHADRPAIEDRGEIVRYAELWRWAAAIGEALRGQGIGPGDRVALALAKSAAYVAALLGVWMAGAAFVPLPPELPARRRQRIADEVDPAATLDGAAVAELRTAATGVLAGSAAQRLRRRPAADELAYVLYTSGSTGAPKGVMVPHRGIPGLLRAQSEAFGLGPTSRSLFVLSVAFDAAISDIGAALVSGAALVIVDPAELREPGAIVAAIERAAITYVDIPPAVLAHLDPRALPACLNTLVIGGEVCPPAAVRRIAEVVRVINVYGPTEATVCASMIACDPATWTRPLLGAPLPGVVFRVFGEAPDGAPDGALDERQAIGEEGELLIGGPGLALGYLGRPELTAARFVTRRGERLYRTGDRVRIHRDGLEFRGRSDRQRKVGGVRIELAEIEAELCRHPGVAEAAVVDDDFGRGGLVAAFVGRAGASVPSAAALREHLRRGLPAAALPRRLVALPALPRSATGKVDLSALARQLRADDGGASMTARCLDVSLQTGYGEGARGLVAAIWREVLGAPRVGPEDRFCQLGGGSLEALEVVASAAAHGLTVSAAALLEDASVAEVAAGLGRGDERPAAELRAAARACADDLDIDPVQEDMVSAEGEAPRSLDAGATLLITGATGFVGRHLLALLRRRHRGRLVALVRGADRLRARARLERAVADADAALGTSAPTLAEGDVEVVVGDLARPRLGLEATAWSDLTASVDAIVHGGAIVNLAAGFDALRPANLDGAARILELALAGRPKLLHLISTLSVFVGARPHVAEPREDDDLRGTEALFGGYAQSKWAAEVLVREVAAGRLPAAIHRLGLVTGDSRRGVGPERDQLGLVLRGLAELGAVPRGHTSVRLDVSPVDHVARGLVELIVGGPALSATRPQTYHLAARDGAHGGDLVRALGRAGVHLEELAMPAWRALGRTLSERSPAAAVAYLALGRCLEAGDGGARPLRAYDLFQATGFRFASPAADAILAPRGLAPPPVTDALLDRYVAAALGAPP